MSKAPQRPLEPSSIGINRGDVLRYTLTPQIIPRVRKLVGSGFPNLSYFIAVVFNTLKILPDNHPYLRADHHGKYGVLQAIAAAANHVSFEKKNIDKITIFAVVLSGLVMLALQFLLWILALFTAAPAFAAGTGGPGPGPQTLPDFFDNTAPQTDLAFRLLDLVFGVEGIFNSSDMGTTPIHAGMHALFEFYSYGILLVGCMVIVYLTMAVVMETAQTGVPFGQRFTKPWAPVRLILFFGLLLPTANHINLAQYLVLNSAKYGSNLATNGWMLFHDTTQDAYLGNAENLVARPNLPDLNTFSTFMGLARVCSWAEGRVVGESRDIRPYFVFENGAAGAIDMSSSTPAYTTMVEKAKGGTLLFRFGVQDADLYADERGAVFPYCGELALPVIDQAQPGAALMQQAYIEMIGCLWSGRDGTSFDCSQYSYEDMGKDYTSRYAVVMNDDVGASAFPDMSPYVGDTQRTQSLIVLHQDLRDALDAAVQAQIDDGAWTNESAERYGWAGAGIWFNKIAEMNGALTTAIFNTPEISKLPYVMEYIKREKLRHDINTPISDLYTPYLSNSRMIEFETPHQIQVARVLNQLFTYWGSDRALAFFRDVPESQLHGGTGNVVIDTINLMMGTRGLFDMCANTNVHPLAQLSSLGKGMIEHSIRGFALAAGVGIVGGLAGLIEGAGAIGAAIQGLSSFFLTFASIGLMMGFILFYVLPFVPFIYFFFAVMTWVKSIFEAMVGMPLWALAHLKIDGEGMPGDSATTGYFHILEIFLRPIGILIGFLGAIVIFSAMVKVLNSIFYLVISNLAGHSVTEGTTNCFQPPAASGSATTTADATEALFKRGVIDEFFFTVLYTIIVFMMALPCFKLVDLIPDHIQRWLGSGISTFGSQDGDPADNFIRNVTLGGGMIGQKLQGIGAAIGFR